MAQIVVVAAIEVGALIFRLLNKPRHPVAGPVIDQISQSANGAPIPFGYGTVRIGGQVFWSSGISFTKRNESAKGGPSQTFYNYFTSFAVGWGEGPLFVNRVWADSKLIWVSPGNLSEYPAQDFPAWSSTLLYNPGNVVSFGGKIYQALIVNTNVQPDTSITTWQLISDYPPWTGLVQYSSGDVVTYNGQLYVAQAPNLDINPTSGDTIMVNGQNLDYWQLLSKAYPQPVHYPGDEAQMPDPTIQSFETANYTPGYRGLGYTVWTKFPLLNFGNRLPNLRAEVTYLKVCPIL